MLLLIDKGSWSLINIILSFTIVTIYLPRVGQEKTNISYTILCVLTPLEQLHMSMKLSI